MTITPLLTEEKAKVWRGASSSRGQAVHLGMVASELEPRESCLRLYYMFPLQRTVPILSHWAGTGFHTVLCNASVLCFILAQAAGLLKGRNQIQLSSYVCKVSAQFGDTL